MPMMDCTRVFEEKAGDVDDAAPRAGVGVNR